MIIKFKDVFLKAFLLGSICNCLISPSYGMEDDEAEKINNISQLKKDKEETIFLVSVHPQTTTLLQGVVPCQSMEHLSDDVHMTIFAFLNQRNVPTVSSTSRRWQRLMDNNQLWKGYAERALVVMKGVYSPQRNYKALVQEHCTPSFTDLSTLNGRKSLVSGINFDGTVLIGAADDDGKGKVFRWTKENGMEFLDTLNEATDIAAYGVNFDGTVIVGSTRVSGKNRTFRWTKENGTEFLTEGVAFGVNSEGSVIIGQAIDGVKVRSFRWTAKNGMEFLRTLNGEIEGGARSTNFDGSVIVGEADDSTTTGMQSAFRWTEKNGLVPLGTLNGGATSSASGVNFDGSVIVGETYDGNKKRAFRWTAENGMKSLSTLDSRAFGVNFDGSVIIGSILNGTMPERAFRWTSENGMESIENLLKDKNLLPPCWSLDVAMGMTPDGNVLIGYGYHQIQTKNKDGRLQPRAWRAVLPRGNLF